MQPADHVFVSYTRADPSGYFERVEQALRIGVRSLPGFEVWTDNRIEITEDWNREIHSALDRCACAILLVSPNFLDSKYIYEQELPVLLCRSRSEPLGLIPVFVSRVPRRALEVRFPCHGKTETFDIASVQGLNGPDTPLEVLSEPEQNDLLARLADKVAEWVEKRKPQGAVAESRVRQPGAAPPVAPSDRRPELTVELNWWRDKLQRRYYFADGARPVEKDMPETGAEHELRGWEPCFPFDGEDLTDLLLGDEPDIRNQLLGAAAGKGAGEDVAPPRHPFRVRLLAPRGDMAKLPWASLTYQGVPLRKSGWTVELSPQPYADQRPQFPNHSLSMPGPVLMAFSRDLYRRGHGDDLQGLFKTLWPKRSALFEATSLEQLETELKERSPRLLYYFGSGRWDRSSGSYLLEMPTRDGERIELGVDELVQCFGARPPQVCFLNLVDEEACRALVDAGALLDRCKAVVVSCAPKQEVAQAAEVGFRWMEHLLVHRSDPVIAFHHAGARCGGCWTAYQEWQTSTDSGGIDDDLVEYFLDRHDQSEHLLGALGELVNRESQLRVQFRLAVGARGNRVLDFGRQAELYLAENAFAGCYVYPRGPVRLTADTSTPRAVETAYRRAMVLGPRADPFEALRTRGHDFGSEIQVPLLCWHLEAEDDSGSEALQATARAVLEWTREQLAIGCPEDLRVIVLLLTQTGTGEQAEAVESSLRAGARSLEDTQGARPSFKFRPMRSLAGVDEDHLRDYFGSPVCWCWDNLRDDYPALMLGGRDEMPFDEAVRLIKRAKALGWGNMAEELRPKPRGVTR